MAFNVLPASIFVPPVASPKFKTQAHSFKQIHISTQLFSPVASYFQQM